MKLGAKILLFTLGLTAGLSGGVLWVVTREVSAAAEARAREEIAHEVTGSLDRLRREQDEVERLVGLLMGEPQNRALLEAVTHRDDEGRDFAASQLRDEVFGRIVQTELTRGRAAPAFHVLLDEQGRFLLASAPGDQPLADSLVSRDHRWPYKPILTGEGEVRGFVWVEGTLYRTLGVALRLEAEGEPTHAYFVGYRISDDLLRGWLGRDTKGAIERVQGWMLVDDDVIARSGDAADMHDSGAGAHGSGRTPAQALAAMARTHPKHNTNRAPIEFHAGRERFLGEAIFFDPGQGMHGVFALASSLDDALAPLRRIQRTIGLLALGAGVAAVLLCLRLARMIARPVERLATGTDRISRGEFGVRIDARGNDELGSLARSFNQMAAGLEQRDLIKDTFGKFVDPKVVEGILADPTRLRPGGEVRVQTVLFADLENFTTTAERLSPEDLVRLLNEYLGAAADEIASLNGIVDKFIGDAVVAFWGPPLTEDHAARACRAALRIIDLASAMAPTCAALGCEPLRARVGVATGPVLVGNIGSKSKFNYTVMGDVVNLGSRLEGLNKVYGTQALATEEAALAAGVRSRVLDRVRVVGRSEPVSLHELLRDDAPPQALATFESARALYSARRWAEAIDAFERAAGFPISSGPAAEFLRRCRAHLSAPPPEPWDGVWNADSK